MQTCWLSDQQAAAMDARSAIPRQREPLEIDIDPVEWRQPKSPCSHQLRSPV